MLARICVGMCVRRASVCVCVCVCMRGLEGRREGQNYCSFVCVCVCACSVATDFADVSPRLRELCEIISPHLLGLLNTSLATEYTAVQVRVCAHRHARGACSGTVS